MSPRRRESARMRITSDEPNPDFSMICRVVDRPSIIAKTTRDAFMERMDRLYPGYEFKRHKGYGTEVHRERLRQKGPCDLHRRSFAPVRLAG